MSELEKAARAAHGFINKRYGVCDPIAQGILRYLESALPPEPVVHKCVRAGCEGVPEVVTESSEYCNSAFIACTSCGLQLNSMAFLGSINESILWERWGA